MITKKNILLALVGLGTFLWCPKSFSEKYNFETTSSGIVNCLTGKTRSLVKKSQKRSSVQTETRGIKINEKKRMDFVQNVSKTDRQHKSFFVNLEILFHVGSHALNKTSLPILDQLAYALQNPKLLNRTLTINGHTDDDGSEEANLKLSLKRATAVKQYLVISHGISTKQLHVKGYGEQIPLVPNTSSTNKQLNRRVEVVVTD